METIPETRLLWRHGVKSPGATSVICTRGAVVSEACTGAPTFSELPTHPLGGTVLPLRELGHGGTVSVYIKLFVVLSEGKGPGAALQL